MHASQRFMDVAGAERLQFIDEQIFQTLGTGREKFSDV